MSKTSLSLIRAMVFFLPMPLLTSCGSGSSNNAAPAAPTGSTVTVTPDEVPWAVSLGVCDNTVMQDTYFNILVRNASGVPLGGVGIDVTLDLSPGTFIPPLQVMYLFDDLDGDGFYTDPVTAYPAPYYIQTGNSGTKVLRVQYDLGGCTYAGNLNVISGPAFGSANISVEEAT